MTHPVHIRRAVPAEAADLLALAALTPGAPGWALHHYQSLLASAANAVWVLAPADPPAAPVIAFAALSLHPPVAELESIVVHPAWQRRGHGRTLMLAALKHAASAGAADVLLEVRSSSPARHLYRALGFVLTGRRPRYYSNPVEDAVLMQWTSSTPDPSTGPLSGIIDSDYGS